ncbi:sialic acid transporter [Cutibacterium acnes JCM 18918]|nr:sialic acid transporter [Cutibacterium acnes JCM 18918]
MREEEAARAAVGETVKKTDMFTMLFARNPKRSIINIVLALTTFGCLIVIYLFKSGVPGLVLALLWVVVAAVMVSFMVQFEGPRWPTGVAVMITVFVAFLYSWPLQLCCYLLSPNPGPGERHRFQSRDRHFFWRGSGLHHGRIYR